ncbi:peptidoglycan DD-metalloendopeptidase family protein [Microbacterium sp. SYP-A9085]|uniref:M23 family metallopeptidase n=1 Tax=Microbacterium sp. SYP-A9085 TaxID=2664454 RepID=UPI00129BB123|nr:M23 family metallopeptidase [Microbacterium sp. SYP-A9085]MRH27814.1 peptidoglycan DD-metalloendopeptidase family protein [Microbacterium sp. SYP-A9085]
MAEPARTRRSARTSSAPAQAADVDAKDKVEVAAAKAHSVMTRAEARRLAAQRESATTVWSLPAAAVLTAATDAPADESVQTAPASVADTSVADTSVVASVEASTAPDVLVEEAPASTTAPKPVSVELVEVSEPAASTPPARPEPMTRRRARRRPQTSPMPAEEPLTTTAGAGQDIAPSPQVASTVEAAPTASPSASIHPRRARRLSAATVVEPVSPTVAEWMALRETSVVTPAGPVVPSVEPAFLSAPPVEPAALTAPIPTATAPVKTAPAVDEFEAAVRLFSFTGETTVQPDAAVEAEAADTEDVPADTATPTKKKRTTGRRRAGQTSIKRMATASASVGAIVAVGLLTVGMTLPADAVASPDTKLAGTSHVHPAGDVAPAGSGEIQAYVAPQDASTGTELDRSANYTTATLSEMAGTTGISHATSSFFTNNPACAVQWPFAVGVPITYGFGWRPGEFHTGVDFTPGSGAHVQAIADGTVRVAQQGYQGYGVAVVIDHEINGQHWASLYGHMQYGSLQVRAGQKVTVGQYLGRTGNTGFSFGAHTHFEIRQDGVTPIDPLPWLRAHNQC